MILLKNDWDDILIDEFNSSWYQNLRKFLDEEYHNQTIYPLPQNIYTALKLTSYQNTKVVILGQDPYHEEGQAHGLSFSVNKGIAIPPSLQNIYKELYNDLHIEAPKHGYLVDWANQGVLLLNSVLTVRAHQANSHKNKGWERLTDAIISHLNDKKEPVVFILWGRNARDKKYLITNPRHLIIESAHPSPLSAYNGFFGSRPFSRTNDFLIKKNLSPIDWQIKG